MIRTLVLKELRESLPIVAAAAFAIASGFCLNFLLSAVVSTSPVVEIPFLNGFWAWVLLIGYSVAVGVGLKQTAWEDSKGTYRYLLFRPIDRRTTFQLKIAVGMLLVVGFVAAYIIFYALWSAWPGRFAAPFYWSMTIGAWQVWFVLPLIYSAAFLSGIRRARWFGSRLGPLIGAMFVSLILVYQPWPWIAAAVSLALTALYASTAIDVAQRRDY
ncbi:hypothetical protein [Lacipirellula parvula]|uniref:Uncharacterized protein n=1 Tax=Lacipirellula parvula TaxID=2650471 RepID=A0A5K7XG05_9BACT|nr:hypothetical protein [Lacipirellula parvula]BBO35794.1 hypothetical protein PLANPX_5406 [Lacipirellula parvula]